MSTRNDVVIEQESDVMLPPDDLTTQPTTVEVSTEQTSPEKLFISIHPLVIGKDKETVKAHNDKWTPHERGFYTPEEFIQQVAIEGHAFSSVFDSNYRTGKNFLWNNVWFLDVDNERPDNALTLNEALAHPFVKNNSWLVYTSPNHQKEKVVGERTLPPADRYRIIFVAEEEDAARTKDEFELVVRGLMDIFPQADPSAKDAARFLYGTVNAADVRVVGSIFSKEALADCRSRGSKKHPRSGKNKTVHIVNGSGTVSKVDYAALGVVVNGTHAYERLVLGQPIEVSTGEHAHAALVSLAGLLKTKSVEREAARAHMLTVNKTLCVPPCPVPDIDQIVDSVYNNYENEQADNASPAIEEVNKTYALAKIGNGVVILDETDKESIRFLKVSAWQTFMANRMVVNSKETDDGGTRIVKKPLAQIWLQHSLRRQYENIVFKIGGDKPTEYNLWRGLSGPEAKEGQWPHIEYHLKEVICSNDPQTYPYLIQWLAHLLQKPQEKPGVAPVMRGKRGVGKGVFANNIVRELIGGRSFVGVEKPEHLAGRFNQHLAHALVVFADEAFFAGDHREQKAINNFITEPRILLEPKGIDVFEVDSYHRVIMASNEWHVVNAGKNERRFLLLDVSDKHMQDPKYFTPLVSAIGVELPAFRWYLEHLDLSDFDPRNAPKTKGLAEQVAFSGDCFERWMAEVRDRKKITLRMSNQFGDTEETIVDWDAKLLVGGKDAVYNAFRQFAQDQRDPRPMTNVQFGIRLLKKTLPNGEPWVVRGRRRTAIGLETTYVFNTGKK